MPDEFWSLSWFEFELLIERFEHEQEENKNRNEAEWLRWRTIVADFRNVNRGKGDPAVKPEQIIQLSFDKKEVEGKPSMKKAKELLGSKFNLSVN